MSTYSRDYLLSLPAKQRKETITQYISSYHSQIVTAATSCKTSCVLDLSQYLKLKSRKTGHEYINQYFPTIEDLVEALKEKYTECRVEYTEEWIETKPGVKEQKVGIIVDWS